MAWACCQTGQSNVPNINNNKDTEFLKVAQNVAQPGAIYLDIVDEEEVESRPGQQDGVYCEER